jgi:gluconate kinase
MKLSTIEQRIDKLEFDDRMRWYAYLHGWFFTLAAQNESVQREIAAAYRSFSDLMREKEERRSL